MRLQVRLQMGVFLLNPTQLSLQALVAIARMVILPVVNAEVSSWRIAGNTNVTFRPPEHLLSLVDLYVPL